MIEDFKEQLDSGKERVIAHNQSPDVGMIQKLVRSRREYEKGEIKLDFQFQFENGEILKATENEDGIASIVIEQNGNNLIDMKDYIPSDFKMVTPTYLRAHGLEKYIKVGWSAIYSAKEKIIVIGDMTEGRHLTSLLHEFGHTKFEGWDKEVMKELKEQKDVGILKKIRAFRNFIRAKSTNERSAWAEAIKIARKIRKQYGVNLLEPIKDLESLKQIIYAALTTHRIFLEKIILEEADEESVNAAKLDEQNKEDVLALLDDIKILFDKEKLID
ncbi:MAG: hypothetical protein Q8L47_05620 [bacterium]|nr:hypothetical protein [bacterium]